MRIVLAALLALALSPTLASAAQPKCVKHGTYVLHHQPKALPAAYRNCKPTMTKTLERAGIEATDARTRGLFAMAVSNRFAPYGRDKGALTLDGLRTNTVMSCLAYVVLAGEVYARIGGSRDDLTFMGWDHGAVGNHVQLWIGEDFMIDPTVGIAAEGKIGQVARGRVPGAMVSMSFNDVSSSTGRVARRVGGRFGFYGIVHRALSEGRYTVSDALYRMGHAEMYTWVKQFKRTGVMPPLPSPRV